MIAASSLAARSSSGSALLHSALGALVWKWVRVVLLGFRRWWSKSLIRDHTVLEYLAVKPARSPIDVPVGTENCEDNKPYRNRQPMGG
jgi:hypothetical protein